MLTEGVKCGCISMRDRQNELQKCLSLCAALTHMAPHRKDFSRALMWSNKLVPFHLSQKVLHRLNVHPLYC